MTAILGIISVILLLVVIYMLARTQEISKEMRGEGGNYEKASKVNGWLFIAFTVLSVIGVVYSGWKFIPMMLPEAASENGVATDKLFNVTLAFTFIVFAITNVLLFYYAFKYSERKGRGAYFFPHSNKLELIWTTIPAIVMTILVVMGLRTWLDIFQYSSGKNLPQNAMVVEVIGQQFKWNVRYPGPDHDFGTRYVDTPYVTSENELGIDFSDPKSHDDFWADTIYLVKNRPVYFKLGALDVLHAFYLPHFRAKMDCVPGVPTNFYVVPKYTTSEYRTRLMNLREWKTVNPETNRPRWQTFMYELACAELCGRSHFGMQKFVMVVEQAEYDKWQARQKPIWQGNAVEEAPMPETASADTTGSAATDTASAEPIAMAKHN